MSDHIQNNNPHIDPKDSLKDDEIDLVELFLIIWKKKLFIFCFTLLITTLVALHQLYIAVEIFRSDAVILPISASNSGGMLAQLGGLASFVGLNTPKSENTVEMILKSRTFAQDIVKKFELDKRWERSFQEAVETCRKTLQVEVSKKDPGITLSWEDENPVKAQEIITAVLVLAQEKLAQHALNQKNLQVKFLEERVADAQKEMVQAEDAIRQFQETNQSIEIERQAEAMISQINALRTEQQTKEVELAVSKKIFTPAASEITRLDLTIDELKKKVDGLIGNVKKESELTSLDERTLMDIPKIGLEYARYLRQVKVTQKIYGLLLEQMEMAKIEAQKNVESFEVLDAPIVPEKRIKPKRTLTVAIAGVCSGMLAVMMVFLWQFIEKLKSVKTVKC